MRLGWGLCSAFALAACTSGPAPVMRYTGAAYCDRLANLLADSASRCCGLVGAAASVTDLRVRCEGAIAAAIDDPRTAFDFAAASAALDTTEASLAHCELPPGSTNLSGNLRTYFHGTIAIGEACVDSSHLPGAAADLACRGGSCSAMGATGMTCAALGVEGSACTTPFDCADGLTCSGSPGACATFFTVGAPCASNDDCASHACVSGACAASDPQRPLELCAPPMMSTLRALDVMLVGFADSATRDVHVRVLDANDTSQLALQLQGLRAGWMMEHVPEALDPGVALRAQVWTSDSADPTGEMRSWEIAIAAGTGTASIVVDLAAATMPLSPMPTSDLDTSFDVQTFGFDRDLGHPFWLRVRDTEDMRVVAQARLYAIPDVQFEITVFDALTNTTSTQVDFVVDANDDDAYQPPPTDHAWRVLAMVPTQGGLSLPFPWSSTWRDVEF